MQVWDRGRRRITPPTTHHDPPGRKGQADGDVDDDVFRSTEIVPNTKVTATFLGRRAKRWNIIMESTSDIW
jgi:hypothetical protein